MLSLLNPIAKSLYLALLLASLLTASGCLAETPANVDWATPAGAKAGSASAEIQAVLNSYAAALVNKDRDGLNSVLDQASTDFAQQQLKLFDRLQEVPFGQYQVKLGSLSETDPGVVSVKVTVAYTLAGSFSGLPDTERAAFLLIKRQDGWKLAGDATAQALGMPRNAQLEDFGPVAVLGGEHTIVLYHPSQQGSAESARALVEAAFPQLKAAFPRINLPKVPIKIFDNKEQIDRAFPGKWQEWTGGAARRMGDDATQGGEIILDSTSFRQSLVSMPGYNGKMLAHELTHIALFPLTGSKTPDFLIEGLADYVAGENSFSLLKENLQSGRPLSPSLADLCQPGAFSVLLSRDAAQLAYEEAGSAAAFIELRYGNDRVLELLGEFKRRSEANEADQDGLVDEAFRAILGIGWNDFEGEWSRYVLGS